MPSQDIHVSIDGDSRGLNKASMSAAQKLALLEKQLTKVEAKLKSQQSSMAKTSASSERMVSSLVSLGAAGAAVGPAFLAAGAGVGAFAALAAPAIMNVVKSQENLLENWDSLSVGEKKSALDLRNLIAQYKALARSLEPETLGVFNQVLETTGKIMPKLAPISRAVSSELGHFVDKINDAVDSPEATEFFQFLESSAGPATAQLTSVFGSAAGAAMSLTQSLAPLASGGLQLVGMLLDLVGAVSSAAPGLMQMVVIATALRGPLGSLGDALGTAGSKLEAFGNGANGAKSKAAGFGKALSSAGAVMSGPWGIAIAAAVGVIGSFAASKANAAAEIANFESSIRQDSGALGANTRALSTQLLEQEGLLKVAQDSGIALNTYTDAIMGNKDAHAQVTAQIDAQINSLKAKADADKISFENYKTGVMPLIQLKAALRGQNETVQAGVDSYKRLQAAQQSAKVETNSVKLAWQLAGDASLTMKERVDALASAMDQFANPALAVLSATNRMKDALAASNKVMSDGKATALDKQKSLESQLGVLGSWIAAEHRATGGVKESNAAMMAQLPTMLRLAGNSKAGKAAIDGLIASMGGSITRTKQATTITDQFGNRIKILPNGKIVKIKADTGQANNALSTTKGKLDSLQSKTLTITTFFKQIGEQANAAPRTARASGGPISGPGTGTSDSIPAWLSNGEYVINAKSTSKYMGLLDTINAGKFSEGGMAGYATGGKVKKPKIGTIGAGTSLAELKKDSVASKLIKDMSKTISEVKSATSTLSKSVKQSYSLHRISYSTASALFTRINSANAKLQKFAAKRDALTSKIDEAKQFSGSVAGNARSFASLGSVDFGDRASANPMGIKSGLMESSSKIQRFSQVIKALAKRGLSKSLLRQVIEAGPDQGTILGEALLAADSGTFKTINKTQFDIDSSSKSLGMTSANLLYDAGKQAGKGFLTGLGAQKKDIIAAMDDIAKALVTRVRRSLKIKSPSRVFAEVGMFSGQGIVTGLNAQLGHVSAAGERLANAAIPGQVARRAMPSTVAGSQAGEIRVVLEARGADNEMLRMLRKMVRVEGRGSVQVAFGKG